MSSISLASWLLRVEKISHWWRR